jgi:hypothetical protein
LLGGYLLCLLIEANWPQVDPKTDIITKFLLDAKDDVLLNRLSSTHPRTIRELSFAIDGFTHGCAVMEGKV